MWTDSFTEYFEIFNVTIVIRLWIKTDTNIENIHLYYDLTAVSIVVNTDRIKLLHIHLKSAVTLFKVITLSSLVSFDKFAQYIVDYSYFEVQNSHRSYLMLTENDYSKAASLCPANTPVYSTHTVTCLSSLFFHGINIVSADNKCFFSTWHPHFNVMEKYGFTTFQRGTGLPCDAPTPRTRYTAR